MFCWQRCTVNPVGPEKPIAWSGASNVSTWFENTVAPGINIGDVDNAFVSGGPGNNNTFGAWQPLMMVKQSQSLRTEFINNMDNSSASSTILTTQTLTDLYISGDENAAFFLRTTSCVAEVAIYAGPLGHDDGAQLMAGASPLAVRRDILMAYFPLLDDLVCYSALALTLSGASPTFADHPPVQDFRQLLRRPMLNEMMSYRAVVGVP